jgi:hypothetical protein
MTKIHELTNLGQAIWFDSDTVNTVPPATLQAFLAHGQLARLEALGIDLGAITQKLLG